MLLSCFRSEIIGHFSAFCFDRNRSFCHVYVPKKFRFIHDEKFEGLCCCRYPCHQIIFVDSLSFGKYLKLEYRGQQVSFERAIMKNCVDISLESKNYTSGLRLVNS